MFEPEGETLGHVTSLSAMTRPPPTAGSRFQHGTSAAFTCRQRTDACKQATGGSDESPRTPSRVVGYERLCDRPTDAHCPCRPPRPRAPMRRHASTGTGWSVRAARNRGGLIARSTSPIGGNTKPHANPRQSGAGAGGTPRGVRHRSGRETAGACAGTSNPSRSAGASRWWDQPRGLERSS
jgi:hypothetical protein